MIDLFGLLGPISPYENTDLGIMTVDTQPSGPDVLSCSNLTITLDLTKSERLSRLPGNACKIVITPGDRELKTSKLDFSFIASVSEHYLRLEHILEPLDDDGARSPLRYKFVMPEPGTPTDGEWAEQEVLYITLSGSWHPSFKKDVVVLGASITLKLNASIGSEFEKNGLATIHVIPIYSSLSSKR